MVSWPLAQQIRNIVVKMEIKIYVYARIMKNSPLPNEFQEFFHFKLELNIKPIC